MHLSNTAKVINATAHGMVEGSKGFNCLEAASWDYIVVCHVVYMRHRHPCPDPSAHLPQIKSLTSNSWPNATSKHVQTLEFDV